jgi:preprotein translocase subunit SecA
MNKDVDYIVKDGKIALIDKFTGRIMEGRSFSDGLHQALEAKERIEITEENETQASITIQNYFRMYSLLCGMTGSATPSKNEFSETYNLEVVQIPTNRPLQREDFEDLVFADFSSKAKKIVSITKEIHKIGRPILIGTTSIEQSDRLSAYLTKEGLKHTILNAKNEEAEAEIIRTAGKNGQIMLATNMAGRGTDILLEDGVPEKGGLHIIGTERHESNRIDMQLRGRSGRQGDPGSSQFIISLEDDLFKSYDEEQFEKYKKKIKISENGLVLSPSPGKFVQKVQEMVEYSHHSSRTHLLKIDSVMDDQSKVIYKLRDRILTSDNESVFIELCRYIKDYLTNKIDQYFHNSTILPDFYLQKFKDEISHVMIKSEWNIDLLDIEREALINILMKLHKEIEIEIKEQSQNEELATQLKMFMIQSLDHLWIKHLDTMNQLKDGLSLRGYAQEDPYRLFNKEALDLFRELMSTVKEEVSVKFMEFFKSQFILTKEGME